MKQSIAALSLALALMGAFAGSAGAVKTEVHPYSRMEDYKDAQFRGLVLGDDGSWRLGARWDEMLADELPFFTEMADDGRMLLLAGGGSPGKLILYDKARGRHESIYSADELLFTCVETLGKGLWAAGSGPGGRVWRVEEPDSVRLLTETGEDFVWDLLLQGDELWLATGKLGRIYRHDLKKGTTELFATLPDQSVFCLAMDEQDRLLAGTSGKGLLYRFDHEGQMELLADFEAEEIQHILPLPGGQLYVAVAKSGGECKENCASVYRLAGGLLEKMLSSDSAFIGDLLPCPEGGLWVSAGDPAELDRLTGLYKGEVLGAEEGVYFGDLHDDGDFLWLLQSKPARLIRIGGEAETGSLSSEVLDLTSNSRAGALRVEALRPPGSSLTLEARGGQGPDPEEGWLSWRPCKEESPGSFRMDLPPSRYFQWRVNLKGKASANPLVTRITSSFLPLNRSPLLGNLSVLLPAAGPFEEGLDLAGRPFTQVLERGVRVQYQQKSEPVPAQDSAGQLLQGLKQISWDWLDPDGDRLEARIEFRREEEASWQLLTEAWPQNIYTWDGRGLADGLYRLRVTVSDAPDNIEGQSLSMAALSGPVRLDNSPPAFELELDRAKDGGVQLRGRVSDTGGGVVQVLERHDKDGRWIALGAADGLMDRQELKLDVTLPLPEAGPDGQPVIELRAADESGNWGYFREGLGGDRH